MAHRRTRQSLQLAAACVVLSAVTAAGQPRDFLQRATTFEGNRFELSAVPGGAAFAAERVHAWNEGTTRRLTLLGDVRIALGDHSFRARRATAWIEAFVDAQGRDVEQVFVYMEEAGDPVVPSGGDGIESRTLPVRALVLAPQPARLSADLILETPPRTGAPEVQVMTAGEEALSRSLRRQAGLATENPPTPLPTFTPASSGPRLAKPKIQLPPRVEADRREAAARPEAVPSTEIMESPRPRPALPRRSTLPPSAPGVATTAGQTSEGPATAPREAVPARPEPALPGSPTPTSGVALPPVLAPSSAPSASGATQILGTTGFITVAPGDVTFVSGEDENAVMASNGVTLIYADPAMDRVVQLTARRAVIFTDPGSLQDMLSLPAEKVRGVYLEGEVTATDGEYTIRGPQVYYDLRANRAVMLDAVFWTYDQARQLPMYVRARAVRQTSATTFTAEKAEFTNSAFFDPELSIGASRVTITRRERTVDPPGDLQGQEPRTESSVWVNARNITGRVMGLPLFYWPVYAGDPEQRIVKDVRLENRSGSGGALLTTLNLYPLLGLREPRNVSADLLMDYYFERGPAIGARAFWAQGNQRGGIFAYTVPFDTGTDVLKSGAKVERDDEFRGLILAEQRWRIDEKWTLMGELTSISDVAVVDAFFESLGETRREFTNRLGARRIEKNTHFSADVSGRFEDYIVNEFLLQSQGYSVTRTPELTYIRQADDLLAPRRAGLLTWFSEYRAGRLEFAFDETLAREHGFTSNAAAQRALGISANQRLGDVFRASGLSEMAVYRLDTRQELAGHFMLGPVTVNPFVVGRVTAYDTDFASFNAGEGDEVRMWGAAGLRASTTIMRVYDSARSRLLDVNRLRHIVEPNLTLWGAASSVDRENLPIYDQDVEGILEGGMMRLGVNQTFQTQRGSVGRRHDVDLLTLNTEIMLADDEAGARSPYGRFFDFRPEYSNPGDYLILDAVMRVTDATSLTASSVYDLEAGEQAATSVGLLIRQWPTFSAAVDVRYLNPQDSTYVTLALTQQLTSKYSLFTGANYDTDQREFQSIALLFQRRFSSVVFGVGVTTNAITDQTSLSFVVRPHGVQGGFGSSDTGLFSQ